MKQSLIILALAATLLLSTGSSFAADQEQIYGSQLMTQQERLEYRKKYTNAKTTQEREQIRTEYHAMMNERAKERNMKLSDTPASGSGMGTGGDMQRDGGMSPGRGMGSGGGMGGGRGH
jgi:hypothetical protein